MYYRSVSTPPDRRFRPSRRRVLAGVATGAALALAGCTGGSEPPDPVTLTSEDTCDVCGMVITAHPGPNAESFYPDHRPNDHDNPARFCSAWEAFQFDYEHDWERSAFYVTDYSSVDYEITEETGDLLISSHPDASAFAPAEDVTFVVASEVKGAMGGDLIPFTVQADAESFRDSHGGELMSLDEVTPEAIGQLGN